MKSVLIGVIIGGITGCHVKVHQIPNYTYDGDTKNLERIATVAGDRGAFIIYKLKVDTSEYIIAKGNDAISIIKNK